MKNKYSFYDNKNATKYKYYLKEGQLKSYNPLHQGHSEMYRKIINEIQQEKSLFKPKYNNNLSDTEGLNKAYTNGKGFFIDGNKLYVAGTFGKSNIKSNINDILSDITIPFGLSSFSERYRDISDILDENHNVTEVISHSLGSSASAKYLKENPNNNIKHLTTYGAPFVSWSSKNNDSYTNFRSILDPISVADRGAITVATGSLNPLINHDYITGYGDTGKDVSRSVEPVREIM